MRSARALLLIAATMICGAVLLTAQGAPRGGGPGQGPFGGRGLPPRDAVADADGTSVIRGRIVAADTGTPIRRAQVRAVSTDSRGSRLASTDADGRFELRDLPAGRWQLTAAKAGFVTLRFGQRRPFEAGRPIELREDEVLERLEMALPRGAAVTGRIFDEFGDPVAGARVQLLRYQIVQGVRRLSPVGGADQTDDTGAFRIYGLMPGQYYLSASLRALPVDDPSGDAAGYAPTYYPGTNSVGEAQALTLNVGQELSSVAFALRPVRTVRVSGTVVDSMGAPLGGGVLVLSPPEGSLLAPGFVGGRYNVRRDGSFTLANVAPGAYTLTAASGRGGGGGGEVAQMPLTVGSEDLSGLYISTTQGATLSGTVSAAAGSTGTLPLTNLQITTQSAGVATGVAVRPSRVESNGAFTLTGLIGERFVRVNGVPASWMVQSMVLNGIDVLDTPVAFRPNEEIRGLRVVLTDRVTEVTGKVAARDGMVSRDYTVVLFPEDESRWTPLSRYVRSGRPDQEGLFRIRGLPPDTRYLAVAVNYLEEGESSDPEFLDGMRAVATRFSLPDGETRALDLELIER